MTGDERAGHVGRCEFRIRTGISSATAGVVVLGCSTFAPKYASSDASARRCCIRAVAEEIPVRIPNAASPGAGWRPGGRRRDSHHAPRLVIGSCRPACCSSFLQHVQPRSTRRLSSASPSPSTIAAAWTRSPTSLDRERNGARPPDLSASIVGDLPLRGLAGGLRGTSPSRCQPRDGAVTRLHTQPVGAHWRTTAAHRRQVGTPFNADRRTVVGR